MSEIPNNSPSFTPPPGSPPSAPAPPPAAKPKGNTMLSLAIGCFALWAIIAIGITIATALYEPEPEEIVTPEPDTGVDAGHDAGHDAGTDAGGVDAGADAGFDAARRARGRSDRWWREQRRRRRW